MDSLITSCDRDSAEVDVNTDKRDAGVYLAIALDHVDHIPGQGSDLAVFGMNIAVP